MPNTDKKKKSIILRFSDLIGFTKVSDKLKPEQKDKKKKETPKQKALREAMEAR